ncbi:hypothetical protein BCR32DRAFT_268852 [Anaeromyces robustus]|jgi:hypothetical protein|uniref:t-SNARE coiled-coil homology domain-containing protein n=1 Tax=Anaeromyces robustus TaxID=1754192 RepID=A0A1Y1X3U4_9FUNG|nr:hypothetical protein BCR32DRAFT_268852 [Anaeromyces robustus]|eukprot:ORX80481.1 hypothetical protein BCR32DRAFT_268852 [Anaeromyces robustus]
MSRYVPKSRRNENQNYDDFGYSGSSNWNSGSNYNQSRFNNEEEEAMYYKQQTDAVMDDTLQTSRNILKKLDQTEQIGVENMNLLAESDERLRNIHAKAKNINDKTDRANEHATELKKYNRAFFLPVINFTSKKRKEKKEQKLNEKMSRREEEARNKSAQNRQRIQQEIDNARNYNGEPMDDGRKGKKGSQPPPSARGRLYTYNKDHAAAQEIEDNLDKASVGVQRLKMMALSMNKTITEQNEFITNELAPTVETANSKINYANRRLEKNFK